MPQCITIFLVYENIHMHAGFTSVLHIRVPDMLAQRLRAVANEYARTSGDVTREALVLQLDRPSRIKSANDDWQPPEAA